jgi:enterochelin esterase-like enzyme
MMHKHSIPHEYRVVDGGHSFQVWRAALPVALCFISDFFDERQQANIATSLVNTPAKTKIMLQLFEIESLELNVFLPYEYNSGNRKYPVIYFNGPYLAEEQQFIADVTNDLIKKNKVAPVVLIFLPESSLLQLDVLLPAIEKRLRVREGKRMRALAGYAESAAPVLERCAGGDFSSCLLLNGNLGMPIKLLGENVFSGNETRVFQVAPDQGSSVEGNGMLHILLREKNIRHEYRLVAGTDGFESLQPILEEVITYTINRFHR